MKKILTNSSLTTFKTCPKKYEFQYVHGYFPKEESAALQFGKIFHGALEILVTTKSVDKACEFIIGESEGLEDEFLQPKCIALLEGYARRYADEPLKVVFAEKQIKFDLLNHITREPREDFIMNSVLDRLLEDLREKNVLLETKTTTEEIEDPTAEYWKRLGMDSQLSTYFIGAAANGWPIDRCIYDVIRKPTIRPKKNETPQQFYERLAQDIIERPNFYYARREIPRINSELERTLIDINLIADAITYYHRVKSFPRHTNSCKSVYGTCPYFKVCTNQISIHDPDHFVKLENKHRELKEANNDSPK